MSRAMKLASCDNLVTVVCSRCAGTLSS